MNGAGEEGNDADGNNGSGTGGGGVWLGRLDVTSDGGGTAAPVVVVIVVIDDGGVELDPLTRIFDWVESFVDIKSRGEDEAEDFLLNLLAISR